MRFSEESAQRAILRINAVGLDNLNNAVERMYAIFNYPTAPAPPRERLVDNVTRWIMDGYYDNGVVLLRELGVEDLTFTDYYCVCGNQYAFSKGSKIYCENCKRILWEI